MPQRHYKFRHYIKLYLLCILQRPGKIKPKDQGLSA